MMDYAYGDLFEEIFILKEIEKKFFNVVRIVLYLNYVGWCRGCFNRCFGIS